MNPAIPIMSNGETEPAEMTQRRPKRRIIQDPELLFMNLAVKHLESLPAAAHLRVADWIAARARERLESHQHDIEPFEPTPLYG